MTTSPRWCGNRRSLRPELQPSRVANARSNRLIVRADADGDVCFFTLRRVDLVIDVNGVSDTGITSFANRRTDTRFGTDPAACGIPVDVNEVPVAALTARPAIDGVATLTGVRHRPRPATADHRREGRQLPPRPATHRARPGRRRARGERRRCSPVHRTVPRAAAGSHRPGPLHTDDRPRPVGRDEPTDLHLLGCEPRRDRCGSDRRPRRGVLVDRGAQSNGCSRRDPERIGPHNLVLDPACVASSTATAGPARPLWTIDAAWTAPSGVVSVADATFEVPMDGVRVGWTWDPATRTYLRSQDGHAPPDRDGRAHLAPATVVELTSVHVPSPVDARSPNVVTLGSGSAVVHRDGRSITAVWSRRPYDPFTFRHAASGSPIPLDVGVTFLELVRDR